MKTRRLLKFSELMEAPYLMSADEYSEKSHKFDDFSHKAQFTPTMNYKHVSTMKSGHDIVKRGDGSKTKSGFASYKAVDPMHKVHITVDGQHDDEGNFKISSLSSHKKSDVRAHDFYHHLLNHFNLISDHTHSIGGMKTWEKLSKMPGVDVKHHSGDRELPVKSFNFTDNYTKDGDGRNREHLQFSRFTASKKKK